jgi:hypothetical protein
MQTPSSMYKLLQKKKSGLKLQVLRFDNGVEFTTTEFATDCVDERI